MDPRLDSLYRRWQEEQARGRGQSVEELCRESPELADPLRQMILSRQTHAGSPDTVPAGKPEAAAPEDYSFLDPPAGPGELGRIGPFRILQVLGQGGMGIVFLGEDAALDRRVAIKVLRPDAADPALVKRFQQEARIAASLRHDHIVAVYQVGVHRDMPYLVMELLHGESLEQRLDRDGWLPVGDVLKIGRQTAEALAAAHARGLIHRDIKPANIWLEAERPGAPFRRVKVLDFGLARSVVGDENMTRHGEIMGTPRFMSPEQIYGGPLDARTDLYSLGCTMYTALTGRTVFVKEDTTALLHAIVNQTPEIMPDLTARMPRSVASLLADLLKKNPSDRPPNADAVANRIAALEKGDTVMMPRPSPTLMMKATGKHPVQRQTSIGMWIGAGCIFAAAVVGLYMGVQAMLRARAKPPPNEAELETPVAPARFPGGAAPIKIGILHSLSGTFGASERPMVDAILLAVEEINEGGGILGREIQSIIKDGHSDPEQFKQMAEILITESQVAALFGCWSSSSRKPVVEVCTRHHMLLFYSIYYEGLEQSPYVVYVGGAPNQELEPTCKWAYAELHKRRFFLVGSDYVYSRVANTILEDELKRLGAAVVGRAYEPLESTSFDQIAAQIKSSKADMILNTIDGSSNTAFFHALRRAGIRPNAVPTVWFSIGDEDLSSLPHQEITGDYVAVPYFESIQNPDNEEFLDRFRAKYPTRRVGDGAEASYNAVYIWKQAVEQAGTPDPSRVRETVKGQTLDAPEGPIEIDAENLHAWRTARIGRIEERHTFDIVYTSPKPLRPVPFPATRSRAEWEDFLKQLYIGWGNRWEKPRR